MLPINVMRAASACLSAAAVSFQVVALEPSSTTPPIAAAMAPKNSDGVKVTRASSVSASQAPPTRIAILAASDTLRQRSIETASASTRSSRRAISSRTSLMLTPGSAGRLVLEIGFDRAGQLDGQRTAVAVLGGARLYADPAFADAVLFDVVLLGALEADADVALQRLGVEPGAGRIDREAVGRGVVGVVAHEALLSRRARPAKRLTCAAAVPP